MSQSKHEFHCHCAKGSLALQKKGRNTGYFIFLLREEQGTSYKFWSWQPCKYLCSHARLRLTAKDIVTGELGMEPYPAQHVNSIFIFLPCSISCSIFPAAAHTCIFITDLRLSQPWKPRAPEGRCDGTVKPVRSAQSRLDDSLLCAAKMSSNECRSKYKLSGATICIFVCFTVVLPALFKASAVGCGRTEKGGNTGKDSTQ